MRLRALAATDAVLEISAIAWYELDRALRRCVPHCRSSKLGSSTAQERRTRVRSICLAPGARWSSVAAVDAVFIST
jgi:hypothetical protein